MTQVMTSKAAKGANYMQKAVLRIEKREKQYRLSLC